MVLVSAAVLAACSGGSGGGSGGASEDLATTTAVAAPSVPESEYVDLTGSAEVTIQAVDNSFRPKYATIRRGTTVTFVNDGRTVHNVIPAVAGQFTPVESEEFGPDQSASRTFGDPGIVPYFCSLHGTAAKGMVGGLRVVE